jgi:hypothetical protein
MTGYWAGRATDYTVDTVLNNIQTSSNWYLFRFTQSGDTFKVAEEFDCGAHVTGSATVDYTPGTTRGLIYRNRMDGGGTRPARGGTSKAAGGGCAMTFDRWYSIRGVIDSYLPADFSTKPTLASLTPLPAEKDPVHATDFPSGAEDTDGDGIPGTSFSISGLVTGVRNSAQRDWREYATADAAPVAAAALQVAIPAQYDLQESVLRVTQCGNNCPLIAAGANASQKVFGRLTLAFLGKTYSDRVKQVVTGAPRQNIDADLATCANIRLLLPHDPSHP